MPLLEEFTAAIESSDLVKNGDEIALAVSGGLDSVVMLDLFAEVAKALSLKLAVVHVEHGLRGEVSKQDLEFVRELATTYRLPFFFRRVATRRFSEEEKLSLEEAARILRYRAFDEMLAEAGCEKVATAHTADDQAETVLDHFLRGSGPLGLSAIPHRRGHIIRPLLGFSRSDFKAYSDMRKLRFREDASNRNLNFKRNRIRHELIPRLQTDFNPNLVASLNRMATIFGEVEDFLQGHAEEAYKSLISLQKKNEIVLEIDGFVGYFRAVQKYVLFKTLDYFGIPRNALNFSRLESALKVIEQRRIGSRYKLDETHELLIDHDGIVIRKRAPHSLKQSFDVRTARALNCGDIALKWTVMTDSKRIDFDTDKSCEFFDLDKAGETLCLRTVEPGDKFVPLNLSGHKKVADYLSDRKVPLHLRESASVLESPHGIIWLCGFCIDDRFKVTSRTHRLIKFEINNSEDAN